MRSPTPPGLWVQRGLERRPLQPLPGSRTATCPAAQPGLKGASGTAGLRPDTFLRSRAVESQDSRAAHPGGKWDLWLCRPQASAT